MEILAHDLKDLPPTIVQLLNKVREVDRQSHRELEEVKKEEVKLLQEVTDLIKAGNKDFDETPYQTRLKDLTQRRQEITRQLDSQVNMMQFVYNLLDGKIRYLDDHMKDIPYIYTEDFAGEMSKKKKKKKKNEQQRGRGSDEVVLGEGEEAEGEMTHDMSVDPNEPVYCTCRRVSYGSMIACENPDCLIEWFHFPCVNLTSEVSHPRLPYITSRSLHRVAC